MLSSDLLNFFEFSYEASLFTVSVDSKFENLCVYIFSGWSLAFRALKNKSRSRFSLKMNDSLVKLNLNLVKFELLTIMNSSLCSESWRSSFDRKR